ncbi:MAG: PAS domain-containing protein [Deltaproteobacteria bacterium]|nr:PAS domain-containing protein [Deltaproteobacteria bacterium]MCW5804076.1 PAS domain-containing protein [Deltaproteobacteria bacterium]
MIRRLRARIFALAVALGVGGGVASQVLVAAGSLTGGPRLPLVAGTALFGATLLAGAVVEAFARRALRDLATEAQNVARDTSQRIASGDAPPDDEVRQLAEWVNFLAEDAQRSHDALTRERSLLSAVAEGLNQGVIAVDGKHRIELINDTARQMLGVASSPLGEPLAEFVRVPQVFELIEGDEASTAEVELSGRVRTLIRVAHKYGGEGRVLLLEDVTAMRRLETVRRDFVANVSHELRTPVAVIRANAETLLAGAKDDPAISTRLMEGLHRNAERLARILADLLDLSRLDAGQYRLEIGNVPVRALTEQSMTAIEPQASKRNVVVEIAIPDDVAVRADPKALDQILVNLIDNGVKYTRAEGNVWVEARPTEDEVRIEVRDDGPGISAKHRERVFERFYRADPSRSREAGGTGLGLSIVKHLVESMNGEVGVEPNEPTGSIFWLRLPRARPSP